MFFASQKHDLAVAQIPKCGIQSFNEWLGRGFKVVANDDPVLQEISRRVGFIRHPLERLKSCYSFFFWMQEYGHKSKNVVHTESWQAFIDQVLNSEPDNEHWLAQAVHVGDVLNIIHRFEDLDRHWETYRPGFLPWNNKATRLPTEPYRTAELIRKYAEDFAMWEDCEWPGQ